MMRGAGGPFILVQVQCLFIGTYLTLKVPSLGLQQTCEEMAYKVLEI